MALIPCPDCSTQVSDMAPACPKCSRPMKVVTIEATGKKFKQQQAIGAGLIVLGVLGVMNTEDTTVLTIAVVMLVCGLGALAIGGAGAWWHHG